MGNEEILNAERLIDIYDFLLGCSWSETPERYRSYKKLGNTLRKTLVTKYRFRDDKYNIEDIISIVEKRNGKRWAIHYLQMELDYYMLIAVRKEDYNHIDPIRTGIKVLNRTIKESGSDSKVDPYKEYGLFEAYELIRRIHMTPVKELPEDMVWYTEINGKMKFYGKSFEMRMKGGIHRVLCNKLNEVISGMKIDIFPDPSNDGVYRVVIKQYLM